MVAGQEQHTFRKRVLTTKGQECVFKHKYA